MSSTLTVVGYVPGLRFLGFDEVLVRPSILIDAGVQRICSTR